MGIATGIDKLLDLVQDKRKITLKRASRKLKITEDKIETWGRILSDEELLDLKYPANPLEPPFLQVKNYEKRSKKKKKRSKKKKKRSKKRKRLKRIRRIKPRAFLRRFKTSSAKRREYRPYKEKRKKIKKDIKKKKKKPKKRKFNIVENQLKLLAIVITTIVLLLLVYIWGP